MSNINANQFEEEQDPVIGYIEKFQEFAEENKNLLIGIAVAIVVLIAGGFSWSYYTETQEQKAQILLSTAQSYFAESDYEKALKGDEMNFTPGLEAIIANYGGTDAGNLAYYYAAVSEFNMGNIDMALGYLSKFDVPSGILGVSPIAFKASLLLESESYTEAGNAFEKASKWVETTTTTPQYAVEAAKAYILAGNTDKAKSLLNDVIVDYPTGVYNAEAKKVLGSL